jgi:tetratricopeptide (TPR) repeat protein
MEFIQGHTLGYWLQSQPRSLLEILEVFVAAGRGLAAAHDKELVHRDFKPENVMVRSDGQVRVMDFGLARLNGDRARTAAPAPDLAIRAIPQELDDDPFSTRVVARIDQTTRDVSTSAAWAEITQSGTIVGTPAYMAPEQFLGAATDARTDQFCFCIALYEALYSVRPFAGHSLAELSANVLHARVQAPPPGSSVPASIRGALLRGLSADPDQRFPSMAELLDVLQQEPAWSGARRFARGAAAKLAGVWESPDHEPGGETDAKAAIRQAFLATGKPYAAAAFEAASRILDRFARRWTELYIDACEATHVRGDQSAEILDLRMMALGEALEDLRALCRELRRATPDTVEKAVNAATSLGMLERCADVKLLRAIATPPDDPAIRVQVAKLQVRLAEVKALGRVGRVADGLKASVELERDTRGVAYPRLQAEVLFASAIMRWDASDFDEANKTMEDAVWMADVCRHDEIVAEAASSLVFMMGQAERFEAAEIWSRHAETVLRRMGGHDLIRGWLFNNRAAMRWTQGRLREAIEDVHLAIEAKAKALGPDDADVGCSIGNASVFYAEMGETGRAVELAEQAAAIVERAVGKDHPRVAIQLVNLAEFRNGLGQFEQARDPAERSLAIFERETDPDGIYVTYPLTALGVSHLGTGRFREALALLTRAVRIRDEREKATAKLGEVHFALARALAGAGEARDTARALAVRALDEYRRAPPTPATTREVAQIERWLSAG